MTVTLDPVVQLQGLLTSHTRHPQVQEGIRLALAAVTPPTTALEGTVTTIPTTDVPVVEPGSRLVAMLSLIEHLARSMAHRHIEPASITWRGYMGPTVTVHAKTRADVESVRELLDTQEPPVIAGSVDLPTITVQGTITGFQVEVYGPLGQR